MNEGSDNRININDPDFMNAVRKTAQRKVQKDIFMDSCVLCSGVCFYVLFSRLFGYVITNISSVYAKYAEEGPFAYCCEMIYSLVCVGVSFLLVSVLFRKCRTKNGLWYDIPFDFKYDKVDCVLLILAGLGLCFVGNVFDSILVNVFSNFGIEFYSYEEALTRSDLPSNGAYFAVYAIRTSLIPALVEEYAFRGVLMGGLLKYGEGFAIAMTSVVFGLMHGNFTQVPFAIIAGIALGFVRVKTGSMWPSIILHFLNNFISVLYSYTTANMENGAFFVSVLVMYGTIFIGIVALTIYLIRNKNGLRLRPNKLRFVSCKWLAFILSPTFLVGAAYLINLMAEDIVQSGRM